MSPGGPGEDWDINYSWMFIQTLADVRAAWNCQRGRRARSRPHGPVIRGRNQPGMRLKTTLRPTSRADGYAAATMTSDGGSEPGLRQRFAVRECWASHSRA